jgi:hypothetical protein
MVLAQQVDTAYQAHTLGSLFQRPWQGPQLPSMSRPPTTPRAPMAYPADGLGPARESSPLALGFSSHTPCALHDQDPDGTLALQYTRQQRSPAAWVEHYCRINTPQVSHLLL